VAGCRNFIETSEAAQEAENNPAVKRLMVSNSILSFSYCNIFIQRGGGGVECAQCSGAMLAAAQSRPSLCECCCLNHAFKFRVCGVHGLANLALKINSRGGELNALGQHAAQSMCVADCVTSSSRSD
jgi:hypothetical protein